MEKCLYIGFHGKFKGFRLKINNQSCLNECMKTFENMRSRPWFDR